MSVELHPRLHKAGTKVNRRRAASSDDKGHRGRVRECSTCRCHCQWIGARRGGAGRRNRQRRGTRSSDRGRNKGTSSTCRQAAYVQRHGAGETITRCDGGSVGSAAALGGRLRTRSYSHRKVRLCSDHKGHRGRVRECSTCRCHCQWIGARRGGAGRRNRQRRGTRSSDRGRNKGTSSTCRQAAYVQRHGAGETITRCDGGSVGSAAALGGRLRTRSYSHRKVRLCSDHKGHRGRVRECSTCRCHCQWIGARRGGAGRRNRQRRGTRSSDRGRNKGTSSTCRQAAYVQRHGAGETITRCDGGSVGSAAALGGRLRTRSYSHRKVRLCSDHKGHRGRVRECSTCRCHCQWIGARRGGAGRRNRQRRGTRSSDRGRNKGTSSTCRQAAYVQRHGAGETITRCDGGSVGSAAALGGRLRTRSYSHRKVRLCSDHKGHRGRVRECSTCRCHCQWIGARRGGAGRRNRQRRGTRSSDRGRNKGTSSTCRQAAYVQRHGAGETITRCDGGSVGSAAALGGRLRTRSYSHRKVRLCSDHKGHRGRVRECSTCRCHCQWIGARRGGAGRRNRQRRGTRSSDRGRNKGTSSTCRQAAYVQRHGASETITRCDGGRVGSATPRAGRLRTRSYSHRKVRLCSDHKGHRGRVRECSTCRCHCQWIGARSSGAGRRNRQRRGTRSSDRGRNKGTSSTCRQAAYVQRHGASETITRCDGGRVGSATPRAGRLRTRSYSHRKVRLCSDHKGHRGRVRECSTCRCHCQWIGARSSGAGRRNRQRRGTRSSDRGRNKGTSSTCRQAAYVQRHGASETITRCDGGRVGSATPRAGRLRTRSYSHRKVRLCSDHKGHRGRVRECSTCRCHCQWIGARSSGAGRRNRQRRGTRSSDRGRNKGTSSTCRQAAYVQRHGAGETITRCDGGSVGSAAALGGRLRTRSYSHRKVRLYRSSDDKGHRGRVRECSTCRCHCQWIGARRGGAGRRNRQRRGTRSSDRGRNKGTSSTCRQAAYVQRHGAGETITRCDGGSVGSAAALGGRLRTRSYSHRKVRLYRSSDDKGHRGRVRECSTCRCHCQWIGARRGGAGRRNRQRRGTRSSDRGRNKGTSSTCRQAAYVQRHGAGETITRCDGGSVGSAAALGGRLRTRSYSHRKVRLYRSSDDKGHRGRVRECSTCRCHCQWIGARRGGAGRRNRQRRGTRSSDRGRNKGTSSTCRQAAYVQRHGAGETITRCDGGSVGSAAALGGRLRTRSYSHRKVRLYRSSDDKGHRGRVRECSTCRCHCQWIGARRGGAGRRNRQRRGTRSSDRGRNKGTSSTCRQAAYVQRHGAGETITRCDGGSVGSAAALGGRLRTRSYSHRKVRLYRSSDDKGHRGRVRECSTCRCHCQWIGARRGGAGRRNRQRRGTRSSDRGRNKGTSSTCRQAAYVQRHGASETITRCDGGRVGSAAALGGRLRTRSYSHRKVRLCSDHKGHRGRVRECSTCRCHCQWIGARRGGAGRRNRQRRGTRSSDRGRNKGTSSTCRQAAYVQRHGAGETITRCDGGSVGSAAALGGRLRTRSYSHRKVRLCSDHKGHRGRVRECSTCRCHCQWIGARRGGAGRRNRQRRGTRSSDRGRNKGTSSTCRQAAYVQRHGAGETITRCDGGSVGSAAPLGGRLRTRGYCHRKIGVGGCRGWSISPGGDLLYRGAAAGTGGEAHKRCGSCYRGG